uniref:RING-type E3 ubiquitin transferase n=1 Tax=Leptobrachium leishanense TaxID=445787 RepID=A0A8C5PAD6_9ANUR
MGIKLSVFNSELNRDGGGQAVPGTDPDPNFTCAVCLQVLDRPTRTRCGHVFCNRCIKASLRTNTYACPYCRTQLVSEGNLAFDIMKKMKTVFQNCEECDKKVCLSDMRAHLNKCELYVMKYGPQEEIGKRQCRDDVYPCPFCHVELDAEGLVEHCFNNHSRETTPVMCPICHLMPGGDVSYRRGFLKHLYNRHSTFYENYLDIDVVEDIVVERVIDISFIQWMRPSHRS